MKFDYTLGLVHVSTKQAMNEIKTNQVYLKHGSTAAEFTMMSLQPKQQR